MQGFVFSANKLILSPADEGGARFRLAATYFCTRPEGRRAGQTPDQKSVGRPKPFGDSYFPKPLNGAGSKKNLLSLKAANSHLWWSGVTFMVFMIVWWLDRLPVISCSNNAAFLTAEQIFLKAWKTRAFSFTPTYWGEPKNKPQKKGQFSAVSSSAVYFSFINV